MILSETALTVLDAFTSSPEKRLQVGEIMRTTGLPRHTVQHALKILTDARFLQRTGQAAATRYQLVF